MSEIANEHDSEAIAALAGVCHRTLCCEGPAIRFEGAWIGWDAIRALAASLDTALERAGVARDAPVAFAPRNSPASLAAFLPLLGSGRRIRMLYPFQSGEALAGQLAATGAAALVMEARDFCAPVVAELQARGMAGIALPGDGTLSGEGAAVLEGAASCTTAGTSGAPAIEILTSGTTGQPKPFAIGHRVVLGYVRQGEALANARAAGARAHDPPPTLLCFPLSNISGLYSLAMSFLRGAPVVLLERFSVAAWRDYVVEYRPAAGGAPPAALAMILEQGIAREDLASLASFSTGAAPVDPAVRQRFEETYGIPVLQTYGATEFGGPVTAMSLDLLREFGADKAQSVGRPFGGARLRIRREADGALAAAGEVGLVEVVSPRMGPEWIATSDLGLLDGDGFLFLRGRADGAVMRGGFKIVPETVEQVLRAHPQVAEACLVGLPDERLHELPVAAVVPRDRAAPPSIEALDAHARQHLAATQVPARWALVDALPRTVSFKTDRAAVRALCAAQAVSPCR
ncbi:long-chain fatty acid--CoA ligase [Novosphingobium sp. YJ-S2-02]|uniref:Long-chain fatty acid--CoA ligase n=1 Tax=Novosphingobium aureum TaxID=2792964 RepID=A0A931MLW5_9SPHN|nr:long-chain fatty acid--CoA ligase [Novosphingobium aureum]MBH0114383.1 long-chain fatty acid--CoA ligase [Novosphingobium aureum]